MTKTSNENDCRYYYYNEDGNLIYTKISESDKKTYFWESITYNTSYVNFDINKVVMYKHDIIHREWLDDWLEEYIPVEKEKGEKIFSKLKEIYDNYQDLSKELTISFNEKIKNIITKI